MLHHVKQHLTPEVAREHFCSGKGNRSLFGLSRRAKEKMEKRKDLPVITEDVVKSKDDGSTPGYGPEPASIVFEKQGNVLESDILSGDYSSSTKYDNVHIGQKFYVASWPRSGQHPLFYAQDYWRTEELTSREQAVAEEVERLAVEDFLQNVNMDKVRSITDRYCAPADKNQPEFRGVCHRYVVHETKTLPTVSAQIAVRCFNKSHSAALEYLARERDPVAKERYKNLLNRDELEVYNKTVIWLESTIKKYLENTVDSSVARTIVDKYDADPQKERVSKGFFHVKTVAEGLAVRHFKKCLNALMEYVIIHYDVETNERFADVLNDEEYELYRDIMSKVKRQHQT